MLSSKAMVRALKINIYQGDYRDDVLQPLSQRSGQEIDPNPHYFTGGGGDDIITGGSNGDFLYGQEGEDTLSGGRGDDHLSGLARTALTGGAGGDIFIMAVFCLHSLCFFSAICFDNASRGRIHLECGIFHSDYCGFYWLLLA